MIGRGRALQSLILPFSHPPLHINLYLYFCLDPDLLPAAPPAHERAFGVWRPGLRVEPLGDAIS